MKILLVDDKAENIYLLEKFLQGNGDITDSASNGAEALAIALKNPPDLIISDILMPVMDGFTLCREWRKDRKLQLIPFIFYTATYTDPKDEEFALSLGADRFVVKPLELNDLLKIIKETFNISRKKTTGSLPLPPPIPEETVFLKEYNEALIRKLEKKMTQIEAAEKELREKNIALEKDIEELKQTKDVLKKTEARFRSYFELSIAGVAITSPTAGWIEVNDQLCEMLGYSREELRQTTWSELTHPDDLDNDLKQFKRVLAGEVDGYSIDKRFICKNGKIIWTSMSVRCLRFADGKVDYFVAVLFDISDRIRAEEKIRESEEKYRSIYENSNVGILLTVPDGTILSANDFACKLFGMTEEELYQRGCEKIVDQADPRLQPSVEERKRTGRAKTELTFVRKDRTKFEGEISSVVFVDSGGKEKTSMIIQDLTERKRAEEKLRITLAKYKTLFECFPLGITVADKMGNIVETNPTAEKLLGVPQKEQMKRDIDSSEWHIVRPDGTPMAPNEYASVRALNEKRKVENIEMGIVKPDKTITWINVTAAPLPLEEHGVVITYNDITGRKQVEEALLESELRFRSLYENTAIGLYRTTPDGKVLLANPALVKMLGYTTFQKLAERNLEKDGFEPADLRKEFLEKIERDGEVQGYESKWTRQDGTVIFVLESARSIRDSDGKTMYYDGTVEDITERRQMEEGLRQMQKLEGLGTLAGGIAHDFNNILGIILAYITSTKRYKNDTKKLDLAVNTIVKAVERGKTLVQQILTFARKTETTFGAVDVNDVVMEIMTMIFETFPKLLTYAQNFDKSIPYINADRSQLYQVLLNLCVNARDAMPKGGVLTINTRMVSAASLHHKYPQAAAINYACIEVTDTGEGMSSETRNRIFEPFFTTKDQGKGTGLGLAVVFGIIQTHKGFIDVESELGKGTTFRLYLPASQVAEPISEKVEESLEEISGGTETLLVVEDEEMLMMSLQMVLVEKGYKVLTASDGFSALKIYQEKKNDISLVLTDLGLPNISGLEVSQQIKKINPKERIILATGFLDPEMKSEFIKAGIEHFLFKPYDLTKVLKVAREVLDKK